MMKIYGLLGKSISYSLSPAMHNAAFRAYGMDAQYRIFDTEESGVPSFFSDLRKGAISGCNVTIPYKEKTLAFLDECESLAKDIGAVNTLAVKNSKLHGYNTDFSGFVETLKGKEAGDLNFDPKGESVFVFGAGGAAKAVIFALMSLRAKRVLITDIDNEKAENLAASIASKYRGDSLISVVEEESKFEELISNSDLVVNATPCGVKKDDAPLFDYRYIHEGLSVMDLIYAAETPLVREAKERGLKAINGVNMLLYQAAASFKMWTDKNAPLEVMRKALLENIKK